CALDFTPFGSVILHHDSFHRHFVAVRSRAHATLVRRIPVILFSRRALPTRALDRFVPIELPRRHAAGRGLDATAPIDASLAVYAESEQERRPARVRRFRCYRGVAVSHKVQRRQNENRRNRKGLFHMLLANCKAPSYDEEY